MLLLDPLGRPLGRGVTKGQRGEAWCRASVGEAVSCFPFRLVSTGPEGQHSSGYGPWNLQVNTGLSSAT